MGWDGMGWQLVRPKENNEDCRSTCTQRVDRGLTLTVRPQAHAIHSRRGGVGGVGIGLDRVQSMSMSNRAKTNMIHNVDVPDRVQGRLLEKCSERVMDASPGMYEY